MQPEYIKVPIIVCVLPGLILGGAVVMELLGMSIWYGCIGFPLIYITLKYFASKT